MAMTAPEPMTMTGARIHGSSKFVQVEQDKARATLEFEEWAPAPISFLGCCVADAVRRRMYAKVYDSHLDFNKPIQCCLPCCCSNEEKCVLDCSVNVYHDRPLSATGFDCCCCTLNLCGPPVIFLDEPMCCLKQCYGDDIVRAPCDLCGVKACLCFGPPCYALKSCICFGPFLCCARPVFPNVKKGRGMSFLSAWKAAVTAYGDTRGVPEKERAIFPDVIAGRTGLMEDERRSPGTEMKKMGPK